MQYLLRENPQNLNRFSSRYTQMNSKVGNMPRRRPKFESGEAGAEAAQLEEVEPRLWTFREGLSFCK